MELEQGMDPCTHCGACFSFCEWDIATEHGGNPGPEVCRGCQICYRICPRLPHDAAALAEGIFPGTQAAAWGRALAAFSGRAFQRGSTVQDGGVAGALAVQMLHSGQVQAVLVTRRSPDWRPYSHWATNEAEVLCAAGSKYSAAPGLSILRAGFDQFERVAIVALPCQAAALARFRQAKPQFAEKLVMVIGLFCSKTFFHGDEESGLAGFIRQWTGRSMEEIERFDIRRGRFIAQWQEGSREWRIKELSQLAWPICASCGDLSAEYADVSLGSVGSPEGKNSIIVRSARARELVETSVALGILEVGPLENSEALEKLCNTKRNNAQQMPDEQLKLLGRSSMRGNWHRQARRSI
jgi:coenzyme F420-reducing hydrogenase beta subunit